MLRTERRCAAGTLLAKALGMHAISFILKRAHRQTVAYGQRVVRDVPGMTPARFDLLYVLRRVAMNEEALDPREREESQVSLRQKLGLHRSTVSKMLARLVRMGWIRKQRCEADRRTFIVSLTDAGRRRIWRAMRRVFRQRTLRKAYELLLRPPSQEGPVDQVVRGTWAGTYEDAWIAQSASVQAENRARRASSRNNCRPPGGALSPVVVTIDELYGTLRSVARWFGDQSSVWFDLGCHRPLGRPGVA